MTPDGQGLFYAIALICLALSSVHVWQGWKMIINSRRAKKFVFTNKDHSPKKSSTLHALPPTNPPRIRSQRSLHLKVAWSRVWAAVFGRQGFFGVESEFFELRFLARETLEIVSQTAQVYKSSLLIGKPRTNNLYVVIIIFNCLSTPVIQRLMVYSPAHERLLCLITDFVLDAGMCMLVPLIVVVPYLRAFNFETYGFDATLRYSDVWFVDLVMENRQIFALSTLDFCLKNMPHVGMLLCLKSIKSLLQPKKHFVSSFKSKPVGRRRSVIDLIKRRTRTRLSKDDAGTAAELARTTSRFHRVQRMNKRRLNKKSSLLVHLLFSGWGIGILVVHLMAMRASVRLDIAGCKQEMRPWFTKTYACGVFEYSCAVNNVTSVPLDAFDVLDAASLSVLEVSHCPELVVPSTLQTFSNLLGIIVYNSTIVEWDDSAAISASTHTSIAFVWLAEVNASEFPRGLLQRMPQSLMDVELAHTNVGHIPNDLDLRWNPSTSSTRASPRSHRHIADLSLIGNAITEMPPLTAFQDKAYFSLALSHNPLQALTPDSNGSTLDIAFLSFEHTNVATMPTWVKTSVRQTSFAQGTPLCHTQTLQGNDLSPECTRTDPRGDGRCPVAIIRQQLEPDHR
ncbi:TPA: hypothetical protein N0F65_008700 [Lagenidium giganteum]|uniref:Leucine-rich repeat domain, L domain-like n=1 Tax=Lagenidium giganteum TaxID=4803 RepID=A0AAV2YJ71_9STRA|nr:TPA: hypothetical protein N0F65_008700 [Lagenidium giganteum]